MRNLEKPTSVIARGTPSYRRNRYEVKRSSRYISRKAIRKPAFISRNRNADAVKFGSSSRINKPTPNKIRQKKLALLLPGHNEELIIATTIRSAIVAGQKKRDIFVVDDNSTDRTREIAIGLLGKDNVMTVKRSGKSLAVKKAIKKFKIEQNYVWLHVADADSIFSPNYFRIFRKKLNPKKYVVALGFVQSMRGNWISTYRAISYTYSQHVNRRVQSYLRTISVFPGPITCFRTDILKELDFETGSLTEDFDLTLQVHRKKLGRIAFIPRAINYTQDPQTLRDFIKQNLRWQRGLFQGLKKYKIGRKIHLIDLSIGYQLMLVMIYLVQLFVIVPMILIMTGDWMFIPTMIAADFVINSIIALGSSVVIRRWNLLGAMPYFYFLRWVELVIFLRAFFEVVVLKSFKAETKGWSTEGRRYELSADALQDVSVTS